MNNTNDEDRCLAKAQLHPATSATETIKGQTNAFYGVNRAALFSELREQAKQIKEGNLDRVEEMLIMQAHTLDGMFSDMVLQARKVLPHNINAAEKIMRLALKSQSQCRSSLETLAEMKNPKPYIQNNRAQYQQVNNGVKLSRAHGEINIRNELLEGRDSEKWMDIETQTEASAGNQRMDAMEEKHRS